MTRRTPLIATALVCAAAPVAAAGPGLPITDITRRALSSVVGFLPESGTVGSDAGGDLSEMVGPVDFLNDAQIDTGGFTLFSEVSMVSDTGHDRIRCEATTGAVLDAVPAGGIALVEAFTRLDCSFTVTEPTPVRFIASVQQAASDTNPFPSASVEFVTNDPAIGTIRIEVPGSGSAQEGIVLDLVLVPGPHRLFCNGATVFDNPPPFVGSISDSSSWSVDLIVLPAGFCPGDCDGSGAVDFNDLVAMLFAFGDPDAALACDADANGAIDFNDLVAGLFLFGPCE